MMSSRTFCIMTYGRNENENVNTSEFSELYPSEIPKVVEQNHRQSENVH